MNAKRLDLPGALAALAYCMRVFGLAVALVMLAGCQAAPAPTPTGAVAAPSASAPTPEPLTSWAARQKGVQLVAAKVQREVAPTVPQADLAELAAGNNDFAFELYGAISGGEENLVFSPYSISKALAMTYAGARGETARQMAQTLGFTLPQERLHPAFNALDRALASRGRAPVAGASGQQTERPEFELNIANALWGQRGWRFLPEFLDTLARNYGAVMLLLDIQNDPGAAVKIINQWASERTHGRIPQVLDSLTGGEKLILTNAVYFNANWDQPFPVASTMQEDFHPLDGSSVRADMMHQTREFQYGAGDGYQAIELPYVGGKVAMRVILPESGRFREIEQRLSSALLGDVQSRLAGQNVDLSMPKFGFATPAISLKNRLASLGMVDAFACDRPGVPDFSGMDGSHELCVGDVLHKAFIDVNETRTEAAAVTAMVVIVEAHAPGPEPVKVRIDRPFLFLIQDRATGSILFLGRVMNPTP
jgi:serpin B